MPWPRLKGKPKEDVYLIRVCTCLNRGFAQPWFGLRHCSNARLFLLRRALGEPSEKHPIQLRVCQFSFNVSLVAQSYLMLTACQRYNGGADPLLRCLQREIRKWLDSYGEKRRVHSQSAPLWPWPILSKLERAPAVALQRTADILFGSFSVHSFLGWLF